MIPAGIIASAGASGLTYRELMLQDAPYAYTPLDYPNSTPNVPNLGTGGTTVTQSMTGQTRVNVGDGDYSMGFLGIGTPRLDFGNMSSAFGYSAAITWEALIRPEPVGNGAPLLVSGKTTNTSFEFFINYERRLGAVGGGPSDDTIFSDVLLPCDGETMHHVAVTRDSQFGLYLCTIYLDGEPVSSTLPMTFGTSANFTNNKWWVGHEPSELSFAPTYYGFIGGVAFHTAVLSPARILAHAEAAAAYREV